MLAQAQTHCNRTEPSKIHATNTPLVQQNGKTEIIYIMIIHLFSFIIYKNTIN